MEPDVTPEVSTRVAESCRNVPERMAWLGRLPRTIAELRDRWQLSISGRFDGGETSWVAPVRRRDGSAAVLKLGMPHMEAEHEADGLRFWDGEPTIRLLEADDTLGAMLLERCEPGAPLRDRPEPEQDIVLAGLLRQLWRTPPERHRFRPLAVMVEAWISEVAAATGHEPEAMRLRAGIETYRALLETQPAAVMLATDLHAGNVLQATRAPWLVIDPKPFVGDPSFDATQHLLNCPDRMSADPHGTIARVAGLLSIDADRVRRWLFARLMVRSRAEGSRDRWDEVARVIAPRAPTG